MTASTSRELFDVLDQMVLQLEDLSMQQFYLRDIFSQLYVQPAFESTYKNICVERYNYIVIKKLKGIK